MKTVLCSERDLNSKVFFRKIYLFLFDFRQTIFHSPNQNETHYLLFMHIYQQKSIFQNQKIMSGHLGEQINVSDDARRRFLSEKLLSNDS